MKYDEKIEDIFVTGTNKMDLSRKWLSGYAQKCEC